MKNIFFSIVLVLTISFGCKEETEPILICDTLDPVADLPWLNIMTNELNDSYYGVYFAIATTEYEDQTVFILTNCCPNCNSLTPVFTCTGDQLGYLSADSGINPAILDDAQVIWKGDLYACGS